jgi:hypothetical protein
LSGAADFCYCLPLYFFPVCFLSVISLYSFHFSDVNNIFQRSQHLENQFSTAMEEFRKRMEALDNQSGGGSCSTTRPHHTPRHPHYDPALDDQSFG